MRKEVIVAIVLGFGLGLLITFGVWQANKKFQKPSAPTPTPVATPEISQAPEQPSPTPEQKSLIITSPENNSLLDEDETEVTGKTNPGAIVVIFYEEGEKILEADVEGGFSTIITLIGGNNEILVKTFAGDGEKTEQTLNVVYSTAEI